MVLAYSFETRQRRLRGACAGAVNDIEFQHRQSDSPRGQLHSGFGRGKDPSKRVVDHPDREAGSFHTQAKEINSPYNCQAFLFCCDELLFFIIQHPKPLANWSVTFVFLFLQEYTLDFLSRALVSNVYWPLLLGRAIKVKLLRASFYDATMALFFSSSGLKYFGCSFLNFFLEGSSEACEVQYKRPKHVVRV